MQLACDHLKPKQAFELPPRHWINAETFFVEPVFLFCSKHEGSRLSVLNAYCHICAIGFVSSAKLNLIVCMRQWAKGGCVL